MRFSPRYSGDNEGTGSMAFWIRLASQEPLLTKDDEYRLWGQMQRARRQIRRTAQLLPIPCKRKVKHAFGEKCLFDVDWSIDKIRSFCERVSDAFPRRFSQARDKNRQKLFSAFDDLNSAFSRFVRANLRLVIKVANTKPKAMPILDMYQEGTIGLMRAVEAFDGRRGHKFSTYAIWWIRQSIDRALADQSRLIRIPVHGINKLVTVRSFIDDYIKDFGHIPTHKEVIVGTGYTEETVAALMDEGLNVTSLDDEISSDGNSSSPRSIVLVNHNVVQPDQFIELEAHLWAIALLFRSLDEDERRVITLRFGLDGEGIRTLQVIGDMPEFQVSRERIRQIEDEAKIKMRKAASRLGINAQFLFCKN